MSEGRPVPTADEVRAMREHAAAREGMGMHVQAWSVEQDSERAVAARIEYLSRHGK